MTQFHNVRSITQKDKISSLEDNLKSFLDWSFLNIGGFVNVGNPSPSMSGTSGFHTLKLASDPTVAGNRLWQSIRKDWIYESGVNYNNTSPTIFSGVYLNNIFLPSPTGSGSYGYSVNYPLGQIKFNNAVSSSSSVVASYSYRYIQVYKASDSIWWKEVQKETYIPSNYKQNGDYAITSTHRVQLPAIILELAPSTKLKPYELGTTENIWTQEIFLHIFAQSATQRNTIIDILIAQKDKVLHLYDSDAVAKTLSFGLDKYGAINPNGKNYPQLVDQFQHNYFTIINTSLGELNTLSSTLYNGIVRWSIEILPYHKTQSTPLVTQSPAPTATNTPTQTSTITPTSTSVLSITPTPTPTAVFSITATPTSTATPAPTVTPSTTLNNILNTFIAIADNSNVTALSSNNGTSWSVNNFTSTRSWRDVAYGASKFIACAYGSSDYEFSTNGITWTSGNFNVANVNNLWTCITYANNKFIILANSSANGIISTDGLNWTKFTLPFQIYIGGPNVPSSSTWNGCAYGNGVFVAMNYNSATIATSTDGITWTQRSLPITNNWNDIIYGNKFAIVAGQTDKIAYSTNGTSWTTASLPESAGWKSIAYGNNTYVAIGYNLANIITSNDLINWTSNIVLSGPWNKIIYKNNTFIIIGSTTTVLTSTNGINWTQRSIANYNWINLT